jgi:hypothetical protein
MAARSGGGEMGGGVVEVRELARRVGDGDFPFGLMDGIEVELVVGFASRLVRPRCGLTLTGTLS